MAAYSPGNKGYFRLGVVRWILLLLVALGPTGAYAGFAASPVPPLPHYTLDARFSDANRTVDGTMRLQWTNHTGARQSSLWFRLYPNAPYYGDGGTTVTTATIDGEPAPFAVRDGDWTVLEVSPVDPVEQGQGLTVEIGFLTTLPTAATPGLAMLGGDAETGWRLVAWFPILAGWEPGDGWFLDPPTRFGDPTFADAASWTLRIVTPSTYTVVASGQTSEAEPGALPRTVVTVSEANAGRDFTVLLLPDEGSKIERDVGGAIVSTPIRNREDDAATRRVQGLIAGLLPLYTTWFGALPDHELDVVNVDLNGPLAVTWNGAIWLDINAIGQDSLRWVVAHELAHLWVGGVIGSNNNDHGFLSEGLANHLAVLALRETAGPAAAGATLGDIVGPYRARVADGWDGVPNQPVRDDTDLGQYVVLVYGKATLGFEALRQIVGDEAYLAWLAAYAAHCANIVCDPITARNLFAVVSEQPIDGVWLSWFTTRSTSVADIDSVLAGFDRA